MSHVWIKTEPSTDGTAYVVTLETDDDTARVLTPDDASRYALGVLDAAHRAAYDAAVVRQLQAAGVELKHAGHLLNDMRRDRPPLDEEATDPLSFTPGVSAFTGQGFLHCKANGTVVGQWDVPDAIRHAVGVLECVVVADLDAAYYKALRTHVGVDDKIARGMVHELIDHRGGETDVQGVQS